MQLHSNMGLKLSKDVGLSLLGIDSINIALEGASIFPMVSDYSTTNRKSSIIKS